MTTDKINNGMAEHPEDPSLQHSSTPSLQSSAILRKCRESIEVKENFFNLYADQIAELSRVQRGHRLWVIGNGGSACDAQHVAVEFVHPIIEKRRPLPAFDLVSQTPVLTAIANDEDFSRVFVDQIDLLGKPGDMVLALTTSGQSPNLIYAIQSAHKKDMLTVAFSGKDGGRIADAADYCFVVPSFTVHRVQECHVTLLHILWDLIHVELGEEDVI